MQIVCQKVCNRPDLQRPHSRCDGSGLLRLGEIERSWLRVLRMIGTMAVGGNAFADDLNAFNISMNRGHRLARWFSNRFGSTPCRDITQCDFANPEDVERYIAGGRINGCRSIAETVAQKVEAMT